MTADTVGGVWTYVMELARGLARHGVRTTVATMGPLPSDGQRREAESIPGLALYTSEYKLEWMENPWEEVDRAGDWLLGLAERVRPDVVHLNGFCHAQLPWPAPVMVVCHSDVLSWWQAVKGEAAPADEWREYAERVGAGLRSAGLVVAPTAAALAEAEYHYGPFEAARVIHNGRSTTDLYPGAKRNLVFSAGRFWDDAKNIKALAAVAPNLNWPTYIAGDLSGGTDRPRSPSLNFLGRLCGSAIGAWYSRAAIYALPAKYEPFGLSALEAALSGCALVLGDIPSLRELWDGAAVFVDPDDHKGLAEAINALSADSEGRERMGKLALERAQEYNAKSKACGYLFAYQDLKQITALDLQLFDHPGVSLL
jgi:glycosyltransferase involved in cell wall biosynthesis